MESLLFGFCLLMVIYICIRASKKEDKDSE